MMQGKTSSEVQAVAEHLQPLSFHAWMTSATAAGDRAERDIREAALAAFTQARHPHN
jgi:hypothetical protein